jgi:hypothetical protein
MAAFPALILTVFQVSIVFSRDQASHSPHDAASSARNGGQSSWPEHCPHAAASRQNQKKLSVTYRPLC